MAFERFYITNLGAQYLALAQAGSTLVITKAQIGTGYLGPGQSAVTRTALISYLKDCPIQSKQAVGSTVNVAIQFVNTDGSGNILDPFWWAEVGLFARLDNDPVHPEILFGYANAMDQAHADYIPGTLMEFLFVMAINAQNAAADVEVEITAPVLYLATDGDGSEVTSDVTTESSAAVSDLTSGSTLRLLFGKTKKLITDILANTAAKVSGATAGNFAGLNAAGNLTDSGKKALDFMSSPVEIAANTDLNTVQAPGFRKCIQNSIAATLINSPTTKAFFMMVGTHAGAFQMIFEYPTDVPKVFMRNIYSGVWGAWFRMFTTVDGPPADTTPTNASANLITSGGVFTALASKANATNVRIVTYSSVTQLGFTAGVPTINSVFAAMPFNSILVATSMDFIGTDLPEPLGIIEIVKGPVAGRSYARFYAKFAGGHDYRLFLTEDNGLSFIMTWYKCLYQIAGGDVLQTLTLLNGFTGWIRYNKTAVGLVVIRIQITPGTLTAFTSIGQMPTGFRPATIIPIQLRDSAPGTTKNAYLSTDGTIKNTDALTADATYTGSITYLAE